MGSESTEQNIMEIDLHILISDFLRSAKRLLWLGILMVFVAVVAFCGRMYMSYTPKYQASASFTVYVANPLQAEVKQYNTATAEQMAKSFPYILTSGALSDMVMQELGISYMPAVSASVLENTNIFTLTVTSGNPQLSYDVLNAFITYYPNVAEFVVGPTTMNLLDESGVPSEPINSRNFGSAIKKGTITGLLLWVAIVLLFAFTRSTIHNEAELKRLINLRCIGMLPAAKGFQKGGKKQRCPIITDRGDNPGFSEAVRLMRIRIERELREHNRKVLLVSSANPGEGKTTVATNLAIALAKKGKRTLLIDCDLRNPSVAYILGSQKLPGLSEYLSGKIAVDKIIHRQKDSNFYVVFAGSAVSNTAGLLSKAEMTYLIQVARKVFDYVILDTPPCSMLADASEVAELADCALYTIRQDYAPKAQILEGVQLLSDSNLPLIGCVMNYMKRITSGISYGYYSYGKYYNNVDDAIPDR